MWCIGFWYIYIKWFLFYFIKILYKESQAVCYYKIVESDHGLWRILQLSFGFCNHKRNCSTYNIFITIYLVLNMVPEGYAICNAIVKAFRL